MLLYRIVDSMTESFYPLLNDFDERIDTLEDDLRLPDDSVLREISTSKRLVASARW